MPKGGKITTTIIKAPTDSTFSEAQNIVLLHEIDR